MNVLVVGATGSIGRLVVDEAIRQGHVVRASASKSDGSDPLAEMSSKVFRSA